MKGYASQDVARLLGLTVAQVRGIARDGFLTPAPGRGARRTAQAARAAEGDLDAEDWYELGLELEAVEPGEARDAYRRALELDAHHADAHVNLGRLLHEQGLVEEAERHYRLALSANPDLATAAYNLGIALEDLDRPADAVEAYRQALAMDPRLADAHYNVARLYQSLGKEAAAPGHLSRYEPR